MKWPGVIKPGSIINDIVASEDGLPTLEEYGSSDEGELAERWRRSPLYRLWRSGDSLLRVRVPPAAPDSIGMSEVKSDPPAG